CYNIHEESPFFVLFFATEIITFPLKGRLSSFIVSGKFPYRVKFYTKSQLAQYERLKGTGERRKEISIGGITLEPDTHRIFVRGMEKVLPNKEFQLLEFLMVHADVVFSRESLYTRIWGMDSLGNTSTVPVHINRLREAVEEDPSNPKHILTIWGVGYKFKP
ncbi:winged helix-turn-helix domain-containing protein, partial [Dialister succinatiphilus]|uniref:winged helix-turn-helix domain-containing protein n=2 Tax=Dialister TaxID=39948 RepID=UPI003AF01BB1